MSAVMPRPNTGYFQVSSREKPGHILLDTGQPAGQVPGMLKPGRKIEGPLPRKPIYLRIASRLKALDMSEQEASVRAGLGEGFIRDIRRKPKNDPRVDSIAALAPVLQTTPEWLAFGVEGDRGGNRQPARETKIVGDVAAGTWLEPVAIETHAADAAPVFDPRYPSDRQFALRVVGTSLNRLARPGDLLLCFRHDDLAEPIEGDLVVVERRDAGRIETTAKRVRRRGTRIELVPESDDPHWQDPIVLDPEHAREHEEIAIIALVTGVYRPVRGAT